MEPADPEDRDRSAPSTAPPGELAGVEDPLRGDAARLAVMTTYVDVAVDALAKARDEIDRLNVYPVPDGDTGTNLYLTISAARDAVRAAAAEALLRGEQPGLGETLHAFGRGALLGARGNSGVILSEMLRALVRRTARATPHERYAVVVAEALAAASDAGRAAVGEPVEGTILSVARAGAEAALAAAAHEGVRARDVVAACAAAARAALALTPTQLPALAAAGVVDAGGRGYCVLLDAAEAVFAGRRQAVSHSVTPVLPATDPPRPDGPSGSPVPPTAAADDDHAPLGGDGPSYEVMYLLDAPADAVPVLRERLGGLGDSLVVVGDDELWNVHVHVDDVGAAIEAGIEAGRPYRIRVTHFAEQVAAAAVERRPKPVPPRGRRVVAVSAGPGLTALFAEAGATVVETAPGLRPSTGEILEAILGCGAAEVVVLANDPDSVRVAQVAAATATADAGLRVAVVPSHAQVQGLAALAVHDPGRGFDADVLEMTAAARQTRHGAVTVAARQAITMAGPCEPGDILGVVSGDFAVVGQDPEDVARQVLQRLLASGGELVTVVSGVDDGGADLAGRVAAWVEEEHPAVDVVVYDGGQQRYPLLVSVE